MFAGGNVIGLTVGSGGREVVAQGAKISGRTVAKGVTLNVSSGTAERVIVANGGIEIVHADGVVSGGTIKSGGLLEVAGGTAHGVIAAIGAAETVRASGRLVLSKGDVGRNVTVSGGGQVILSSGGRTTGTVIGARGVEIVKSGAVASQVDVKSGGEIRYAGGAVTGLTLEVGADIGIGSGGKLSGSTVSAGSYFAVYSGGAATGVHVLSGGNLIYGGGTVTGATFDYGGSATIASGVTESALAVVNDETLFVESGGKAAGTTVNSGGVLVAEGVGVPASNTVIESGGIEYVVSGFERGGTVLAGGKLVDRAAISNVTISSGGLLELQSGGTFTGLTIKSGGIVVSANDGLLEVLSGILPDYSIAASDRLQVDKKAGASNLSVGGAARYTDRDGYHGAIEGGILDIAGGTVDGFTAVSGATVNVGSGGLAQSGTIQGLAAFDVGYQAYSMTVEEFHAQENVSSGGKIVSNTVADWGEIALDGTAVSTTVGSGGTLTVNAGGRASGVTILSSGLVVDSAFVDNVTVQSGGILLLQAGGTAKGVTLQSGGVVESSSGKYVALISGDLTSYYSFAAGSTFKILVGASATDINVPGAYEYTVSDTRSYSSAGTLVVNGTVGNFYDDGAVRVNSGGMVIGGMTVDSGGSVGIKSGGTVMGSNVLSSGGEEIVSSGGIIGGTVTFISGGRLKIDDAVEVSVALSGFGSGDTLDLANFKSGPSESFSYVSAAGNTSGLLTVSSGGLNASITLFGQYVAGGFKLASDGATGTNVTYTSSGSPLIAPHHG